MGRSRSRSPSKRHHRNHDHKRSHKKRSRTRSRSPIRSHERRLSSRDHKSDRSRNHKSRELRYSPEVIDIDIPKTITIEEEIEEKNIDEQMKQLMGFSSFDSTKGKKVEGNDVGEVHVILKRKYRQYMNRKGGFNRPLDNVA